MSLLHKSAATKLWSQIIKRPSTSNSTLLLHENGPCGGMGDAGGRSGTGGVDVAVAAAVVVVVVVY